MVNILAFLPHGPYYVVVIGHSVSAYGTVATVQLCSTDKRGFVEHVKRSQSFTTEQKALDYANCVICGLS